MLRNVVLTLGVGGVFVVLNEVLSLNAQEFRRPLRPRKAGFHSSMKS